jgi:thiol-disulfide isomerase/thioredoxin
MNRHYWLPVAGLACAGLFAASGAGEDKRAAPEFVGVSEWINSEPLKVADLKGKVVAVHFWTNGCINCVNNYPHYRAWQDKYTDNKSLVVVGIHTTEFEGEKDVARIKERMRKHNLVFPVAVDNDSKNWRAWENRYWPCLYLVDATGEIRYRWEGEFGDVGFKAVTAEIEKLLAEKAK